MSIKEASWAAVLAAIIGGVYVLYRLFEPLIVYNAGWSAPPSREDPPAAFETAAQDMGDAAAAAETALRAAYRDTDHPALSAAVGGADGLLWRGAIGHADIDTGRAVAFGDSFRIGSSSKAVTAMAVGVLMDEGLLRLDMPLREIDPTLPPAFDAMTLGHVMSHRGGVRNYGMCFCFPAWEFLNRRKFSSVREAVKVIEDDPLLFPPGTDFQYTSLGYNLSGLAVAQASGVSYPQALRDRIAGPLGMNATQAEGAPGGEPPGATFYDVEPRGYKKAYRVDNSIKWPSGGLLSTPTDMIRLGAAMLDDRFLTPRTRAALLAVPEADNGSDIYAHGWRVSPWALSDGGEVDAWHHHGTAAGSRSVFFVLPDEELVVSLMTNKNGESVNDLAAIAAEIAMPFVAHRRSVSSTEDHD